MTNKLTGREALAYMATGGWFGFSNKDTNWRYRIANNGEVLLWSDRNRTEITGSYSIDFFCTFGITPCPDPTVKVDEYEEEKKAVINAIEFAHLRDERENMIGLFEKWFQRKEVK